MSRRKTDEEEYAGDIQRQAFHAWGKSRWSLLSERDRHNELARIFMQRVMSQLDTRNDQALELLSCLCEINGRLSRRQRYGIEVGIQGKDRDFEALRRRIDVAVSGGQVPPVRDASAILKDLLRLSATEGREPVIELHREARALFGELE